MSLDFVGGVPSSYIATLLSLWGSYEIGNNGVCNVSSNSNSNSNAEVPCRDLLMAPKTTGVILVINLKTEPTEKQHQ